MQWTTVNAELILTNRQPSGYDYRIRLQTNGSALLVAEGRISDGKTNNTPCGMHVGAACHGRR